MCINKYISYSHVPYHLFYVFKCMQFMLRCGLLAHERRQRRIADLVAALVGVVFVNMLVNMLVQVVRKHGASRAPYTTYTNCTKYTK